MDFFFFSSNTIFGICQQGRLAGILFPCLTAGQWNNTKGYQYYWMLSTGMCKDLITVFKTDREIEE